MNISQETQETEEFKRKVTLLFTYAEEIGMTYGELLMLKNFLSIYLPQVLIKQKDKSIV
jgi:acetylornithine deacetylase/succinyl-diaminopimelate desuccinylase-like protein